ncbi:MAG: LuxR C-terminal-related transcriptional regulator [Muribaculaceae bacterium]|nr:LuxR C-terminal-related transcriptional regulator [Muribaculaceae bacterium]
MLILFVMVACMVSCSRRERHIPAMREAERIAATNPDGALALLKDIEARDLNEDSLRALYYLVTAAAHKGKESSMVSDSMVRFSFEYYKERDRDRYVRSADLYALHLFWSGDGKGALALLDSVLELPDIAGSLTLQLLESRIGVGGALYDCKNNIRHIKRMLEMAGDPASVMEYKGQLCENYQFAGYGDSALAVINEMIDYASRNHLGEDQFTFAYEKIGILEELGRYAESNALADYLMVHAPQNSAMPYLHYWKALNYFNMGDFGRSSIHLALADSCAAGRDESEYNYYKGFTRPLHEFLDYRKHGTVSISQLATFNNAQRDIMNRMESTRLESEQNALKQENRALALKAQNERKTAVIIIVALAAIIIAICALWNAQKRKRMTMEAEERAEALRKMVDEMSRPAGKNDSREALRRAMLQQLGIIKMVAETPTEQNRDMLRKISSIGTDTRGALVDWSSVYEIIDNLYAGFYSRLHSAHGQLLSEKEEQIVALMVAGFSTKEISVITSQTAATIYVRKSSIRKKLGVPEKEDIVAFLRSDASI